VNRCIEQSARPERLRLDAVNEAWTTAFFRRLGPPYAGSFARDSANVLCRQLLACSVHSWNKYGATLKLPRYSTGLTWPPMGPTRTECTSCGRCGTPVGCTMPPGRKGKLLRPSAMWVSPGWTPDEPELTPLYNIRKFGAGRGLRTVCQRIPRGALFGQHPAKTIQAQTGSTSCPPAQLFQKHPVPGLFTLRLAYARYRHGYAGRWGRGGASHHYTFNQQHMSIDNQRGNNNQRGTGNRQIIIQNNNSGFAVGTNYGTVTQNGYSSSVVTLGESNTVIINGTTFTFTGRKVEQRNGRVFVDDRDVTDEIGEGPRAFKVTIQGNVDRVEGCQ
jgi:hypothetical protein